MDPLPALLPAVQAMAQEGVSAALRHFLRHAVPEPESTPPPQRPLDPAAFLQSMAWLQEGKLFNMALPEVGLRLGGAVAGL